MNDGAQSHGSRAIVPGDEFYDLRRHSTLPLEIKFLEDSNLFIANSNLSPTFVRAQNRMFPLTDDVNTYENGGSWKPFEKNAPLVNANNEVKCKARGYGVSKGGERSSFWVAGKPSGHDHTIGESFWSHHGEKLMHFKSIKVQTPQVDMVGKFGIRPSTFSGSWYLFSVAPYRRIPIAAVILMPSFLSPLGGIHYG
ncbi:hypothetical protein TNCV_2280381 [Trichonephila clavipes]|nr:hypothetical protein TNCV_2280381 [Trichonephila clavipes]